MTVSIDIEDRSGVSLLRLTGELLATDNAAFVDAVMPLVEQGTKTRIVLDLGGVTLISSIGLGSLVRVTAQVNSRGGRMLLANLRPFVADVLKVTDLDKFFEICESVEDALEQLA